MINEDTFEKSETFKQINEGNIGWYCEWCGKEKILKNKIGAKKLLKEVRDHSLNCPKNPLHELIPHPGSKEPKWNIEQAQKVKEVLDRYK